MKKNLLALSIAAMVGGIAGGANAQVAVDTIGTRLIGNSAAALAALPAGAVKALPGTAGIPAAAVDLKQAATGVGHILFVPYFSTQDTNSTLLNLVNTDQVNGKAVKLRFRGAANSDDLFDITIFLSPGDVWAANVSANGDISALSTNDTSCTLPSAEVIKAAEGKFSTRRVMNNDAKQTREGYIEILNMADVVPGSALFTATKHVNGKAPCTQAVMDQQMTPLSIVDAANYPATRGYSWPTGGLMANWTIVNVGTKASFSGEAVALRATSVANNSEAAGAAQIVFSPQNSVEVAPTVARTLTADPLLQLDPTAVPTSVITANYDFPDLSTPYTNSVATPEAQAIQLSDALATFSVSNEYVTDPTVSFATDWVFAMPTRRYAVAVNYGVENKTAAIVSNAGVTKHFRAGVGGNVTLDAATKLICVKANQPDVTSVLVPFDREERSNSASFVISPGAPDQLKFCGETNVFTFNGKASVLNAQLATQNITTGFTDGWLYAKTPGLGDGLPVVGYAVGKAVGPAGSNFGGTWMHRTNKVKGQAF